MNETERTTAQPRSRWRPRVVQVTLVINVIVFAAWLGARVSPGLRELMLTDFLVSPSRILAGRWWTVLTSVFSHLELWHLLINMLVLWSFGPVIERVLGHRKFAAFYVGTGVLASISHCLTSALLLGNLQSAALGASGALSGVLLVFALLFPRHKILVFGIIPIPALIGALAFVGLDVWGLVAQAQGGGLPIGHGAHLGGAVCGFLYWLVVFRDGGDGSGSPYVDVERLLNKLRQKGPEALTPEERDRLRRLHERMTRDGESSEPS